MSTPGLEEQLRRGRSHFVQLTFRPNSPGSFRRIVEMDQERQSGGKAMHAPGFGSSGFITVDRRKFLAGAGALIAAGLLPLNVLALAAPFRFKQGALDVSVLGVGHLILIATLLAPVAPAVQRT